LSFQPEEHRGAVQFRNRAFPEQGYLQRSQYHRRMPEGLSIAAGSCISARRSSHEPHTGGAKEQMIDWKSRIAQMVYIKQTIFELDAEHLWEYRLPRVASTEAELLAVEASLGEQLNPEYRSFLGYAGGWPAFYQTVDLFGPFDVADSTIFSQAMEMLASIENVVLDGSQLRREDLIPIAATSLDLDLFVITRRSSPSPGQVIWFAGGEVDRFPSFGEYFLAMMEYNRREIERLRTAAPRASSC